MATRSTSSDKAIHRSVTVEELDSESEDQMSSPPSYEILTYPADYTLEVLNDKLKKGDISVPQFQRRFVWLLPQASKLIESFLLGLPVPPVFLYARSDGETIVVDGQQRLRTIQFFFSGQFGDKHVHPHPVVFRLTGLHPKSPFANKTYEELELTDPPAFKRLNDAVLRAFVVKQLNPKDTTSIYHIFERLNTGGTILQGQEIRNCVYDGPFNDLLHELNDNKKWREVFGKPQFDKRQRDVELILRFFALLHDGTRYEKPMKDFLSGYMAKHKKLTKNKVQEFRATFLDVLDRVFSYLGKRPFHIRAGLNAAVYDSVFVAFGQHPGKMPGGKDRSRFDQLLRNERYLENVSTGTTDKEVIRERMQLASSQLFGK